MTAKKEFVEIYDFVSFGYDGIVATDEEGFFWVIDMGSRTPKEVFDTEYPSHNEYEHELSSRQQPYLGGEVKITIAGGKVTVTHVLEVDSTPSASNGDSDFVEVDD